MDVSSLLKGLRMMDFCNEVESSINHALSNMTNISGGGIIFPCKRCENKKFIDLDVAMMLLHKLFMEKNLCWFAHKKLYVPYKIMVEKMIGSISSSTNV